MWETPQINQGFKWLQLQFFNILEITFEYTFTTSLSQLNIQFYSK
jgi:hypothetical protein